MPDRKRTKRRPRSTPAPARAPRGGPPPPSAAPGPDEPPTLYHRRRDLAGTLRTRAEEIETTADPAALLAAAGGVVEAGHAVEGLALEGALRRADGMERRAAAALELPPNSLRRLIHSGGRHAALGPLAADLRAAVGYTRGNPNMRTRPAGAGAEEHDKPPDKPPDNPNARGRRGKSPRPSGAK